MLGFGVIHGKKMHGWVRSKPHPLCTRRAMASSFEVKAVWYEVTTSIKRSGMHKLATTPCSAALFPIIAFCSGVYFPYWPLFLLLFDSVVERTSEFEDATDVDGQVFAISFPLEVLKYEVNRLWVNILWFASQPQKP